MRIFHSVLWLTKVDFAFLSFDLYEGSKHCQVSIPIKMCHLYKTVFLWHWREWQFPLCAVWQEWSVFLHTPWLLENQGGVIVGKSIVHTVSGQVKLVPAIQDHVGKCELWPNVIDETELADCMSFVLRGQEDLDTNQNEEFDLIWIVLSRVPLQ